MVAVVLLLLIACGTTTGVTCVRICCIVAVSTLPRSVMYAVSPGPSEIVGSVTGAEVTLGFGKELPGVMIGTLGTLANVMSCCWVMSWQFPLVCGVM